MAREIPRQSPSTLVAWGNEATLNLMANHSCLGEIGLTVVEARAIVAPRVPHQLQHITDDNNRAAVGSRAWLLRAWQEVLAQVPLACLRGASKVSNCMRTHSKAGRSVHMCYVAGLQAKFGRDVHTPSQASVAHHSVLGLLHPVAITSAFFSRLAEAAPAALPVRFLLVCSTSP